MCSDPSAWGDYILIAKDNQPTLREEIADLFEDRLPDPRRWKHARRGTKDIDIWNIARLAVALTSMDWFSKHWEGIEQVFRLERTACLLKTNRTRHEVVYGLSSLSMQQAPATVSYTHLTLPTNREV